MKQRNPTGVIMKKFLSLLILNVLLISAPAFCANYKSAVWRANSSQQGLTIQQTINRLQNYGTLTFFKDFRSAYDLNADYSLGSATATYTSTSGFYSISANGYSATTSNDDVLSYAIASNRTSGAETVIIGYKATADWASADRSKNFLTDTDTQSRLIYHDANGEEASFAPNFTSNPTSISRGATYPLADTLIMVSGVSYGASDATNSEIFFGGYSELANTTNYTAPSWGTNFYIGSDNAGANQAEGKIAFVIIYSGSLTATQINSISSLMDVPVKTNISIFNVRDNAGAKSNDTDYFQSLSGVSSSEMTDIERAYFVVPSACTIKRFRVKWDGSHTGTQAIEYYLVINGNSTLLATVDSTTDDTVFNNSLSIPLVAGDLVAYKMILRNTPTVNHNWLTLEIESPNQMLLMGNNKALHNAGAERFFVLNASTGALQATNAAAKLVFPSAVVLRDLICRVSTAPGDGNIWTCKIVNDAFATVGSCTITGSAQTCTVTSNSARFAAVSGVYGSISPTTGTPTNGYFSYGVTLNPSVKGEYPLMFTDFATPSTTVPEWNYLLGPKFYLEETESPYPVERGMPIGSGFIMRNFFFKSTAPGVGKSRAFAITYGTPTAGYNTAIFSATAVDAETTGSDSSSRYVTVEGEEYNLRHTPTGTPASTGTHYAGIVLYK